ncbi:hypothetical protein ASPBRDRAFT_39894 [Aspergillus brasiliensis CBS 101740]|uniref:Uncharacterized protein n=1 Tax=Aspergillus brasiliensis (strain CBS 101740 / IMI 381727 / IBT 21946) TaxID=767769 RepID=A0A1L9USU2_ASPBC|nr:hypothetical protein ASPBRDRAFT_39894 [Aspergillus brasiliensis CBS 101740]
MGLACVWIVVYLLLCCCCICQKGPNRALRGYPCLCTPSCIVPFSFSLVLLGDLR